MGPSSSLTSPCCPAWWRTRPHPGRPPCRRRPPCHRRLPHQWREMMSVGLDDHCRLQGSKPRVHVLGPRRVRKSCKEGCDVTTKDQSDPRPSDAPRMSKTPTMISYRRGPRPVGGQGGRTKMVAHTKKANHGRSRSRTPSVPHATAVRCQGPRREECPAWDPLECLRVFS